MSDNFELMCSFCGRPKNLVKQLIAGPNGVFICDECIQICSDVLHSSKTHNEGEFHVDLPSPSEIKARLDEYIIGQDDAKRVLSVAVYNHYKRINSVSNDDQDEVELEKSNVLMLGPTGCGKTLLAKTLAKILKVPFAVADATTLTEAGYVGEDVENILLKLIQAADYDIKKAEKGIIYIDEIDKIARKGENVSITRDVSGEGVQQALLKIIESTVASVPPQGGRKHPQQELLQIDTTNILFIVGGAFVGLEKIIQKRKDVAPLGFGGEVLTKVEMNSGKLLKEIQPQDLTKFGLIPEFVGRVPVVVSLDPLDEKALCKILTEPKNSLIKQYKKLLKLDNVELSFDESAISAIAQKAIELKTGARGLRTIMESLMIDLMYDVPDQKDLSAIEITREFIERTGDPVFFKNEKSA